ncbi:ribosome maturation factor RimP [Candidatus Oleimmundimicrobium sp.]|uniref:ribosome maturation factor RimP n=1 Tax=Candidatus Oleimmundimicrobium sp. TaxID=3060597 RepID=UPI00271E0B68|nr:ribosome maturation factor RimP [Candidatus Oleimmundimicrobium sp.]MDO8885452.1 ribosome maturation factor RimP [Candidatus Oleimmundimicrobium sp.]
MDIAKISKIKDLVNQALLANGFELVDIEFKKESVGMVLRIYIDSDKGVTIDMCTKASGAISKELDNVNLLSQNYILEVSSPGIERPLTKPKHFKKYIGSKICVKTKEPIKKRSQFKGILESAKDDLFVVNCDGEMYEIPYGKLKKANVVVEIDL